MSTTFEADTITAGFADELEKLGFEADLEKLALFGIGKKPPAPEVKGLKGMVGALAASPVGRLARFAMGPGYIAFEGFNGLKTLSKNNLAARRAATTIG